MSVGCAGPVPPTDPTTVDFRRCTEPFTRMPCAAVLSHRVVRSSLGVHHNVQPLLECDISEAV